MNDKEMRKYRDVGYSFLSALFSKDEVGLLKSNIEELKSFDSTIVVYEDNNSTVRSIHGDYRQCEQLERVVKDPRLLDIAKNIVGDDVYVHQFKVNYKEPFHGDIWPWHQDSVYWIEEDGIESDGFVNIAILLDEVNEFNAPLFLIEGSHLHGVIDPLLTENSVADLSSDSGQIAEGFSKKMKYCLDEETVVKLVDEGAIVAPKGAEGSVLVFDPNIAHCSVSNLSPFKRTFILITYNSIYNKPKNGASKRAEFLVESDFEALESVGS